MQFGKAVRAVVGHRVTLENRAHAEVDRAREETKALRREHDAAVREHATAQRAWRQELSAGNAAATAAKP